MESKGRRAGRAAAPGAIPAEAVNRTSTSPGAEQPVEVPAKEFIPAEASVELVAPVVAVAAPPRDDTLAAGAKNSSGEVADFSREVFAALVQSQTAVARGLEALSVEATGLAISGIDAATRTVIGMLPTGNNAHSVAVDPVTGFVYMPYSSDTAPAGFQRSAQFSGLFDGGVAIYTIR